MCVRLEVLLPTVEKFLFLYSLQVGCIVILLWTMARSIFCLMFFVLAILEILIKQALPFGFLLPKDTEALPSSTIIGLYFVYLGIVLAEAFLILDTIVLAHALMKVPYPKPLLVRFYLILRTLTWVVETVCLAVACALHPLLIGWYIGFLFFVILELYAWVVVYSYYYEIEDKKCDNCPECPEEWAGSLIIGYVSIFGSLFSLATMSYFVYRVVKYVEANKNHPNPEHPPDELAQVALGVYVSQAFYLLVFLLCLIISIMLVVGVHTEKPKLLKFYVFSGFFLFGLSLGLVVVSMVFVGFLATLPLLKWCFVDFLCLLIVRSTYLDMEERNKPRVFEMHTLYSPQQAPLMA